MRWVDRIAEAFGSLPFLIFFNCITVIWVGLGIYAPQWWPDPYPSTFYTLLVSWLAIDMSSLVLWSERQRLFRDKRLDRADRRLLKAMYTLVAETEAEMERAREQQRSILALLESQMAVVDEIRKLKGEGDRKC